MSKFYAAKEMSKTIFFATFCTHLCLFFFTLQQRHTQKIFPSSCNCFFLLYFATTPYLENIFQVLAVFFFFFTLQLRHTQKIFSKFLQFLEHFGRNKISKIATTLTLAFCQLTEVSPLWNLEKFFILSRTFGTQKIILNLILLKIQRFLFLLQRKLIQL